MSNSAESKNKKEKMELKKEIKEEKNGEERKRLLQNSEVSLILDTYEDIFSDFDPRPFNQRAISYDFLEEAKRATRDLPTGQVQLKFLIPYKLRNIPTELAIKKRLKDHFAKHHSMLLDNLRKLRMKSVLMAILGVGLTFVATTLLSVGSQSYPLRFLEVLLEPAGWFLIWTGFEELYYTGRDMQKEHTFYDKMSQAEITFLSY